MVGMGAQEDGLAALCVSGAGCGGEGEERGGGAVGVGAVRAAKQAPRARAGATCSSRKLWSSSNWQYMRVSVVAFCGVASRRTQWYVLFHASPHACMGVLPVDRHGSCSCTTRGGEPCAPCVPYGYA